MKTHADIDLRSLEFHKHVVVKIENDPSLKKKAFEILDRWTAVSPHRSRKEWRDILSLPWSKAKEVILEDTENGRRIRQTSPLPCLLSKEERGDIAKRWLSEEEKKRYDDASGRDI